MAMISEKVMVKNTEWISELQYVADEKWINLRWVQQWAAR